jgi:hypothetical protein
MIVSQESAIMIYFYKELVSFLTAFHNQQVSVTVGPYSNDIGLIKVRALSDGGISFNSHVRPICLPEVQAKGAAGSWCSVTGWGAQRREYAKYCRPQVYSIYYMNHGASSSDSVVGRCVII